MATNVLKRITAKAKELKRKHPGKKWTSYIKEASKMIKHKRSAATPRKKVVRRKKRSTRKRISSINIAKVGNYVGRSRSTNVNHIPGSAVSSVGLHHAVDQKALNNLNYLVKELDHAQQNYEILKGKKRKKQLTDPFHKKLFSRYPGYIKSLKKQISESKKNIR